MVTIVKKTDPATEGQPAPDAAAAAADPGLADLAAQAASLEGEAGPVAGVAAVQSDNLEAELLSALQLARVAAGSLLKWWPEFREVWSDQALANIASAGAEVMRRHGWNMGELLSQWGPYIALVGAITPPAMVTYQAMQDHKAEQMRAARAAREGATNGGQG